MAEKCISRTDDRLKLVIGCIGDQSAPDAGEVCLIVGAIDTIVHLQISVQTAP